MQIVNKLKKIIISMSICFAHGPSGDVFILLQIQFYASRQKTLLPFELAQDRKYPFAKQRGDMPVGESETRESDVASETEGASPSVSGTKMAAPSVSCINSGIPFTIRITGRNTRCLAGFTAEAGGPATSSGIF
ncbi:uncharacterized protein LOC143226836 isoform X2 [Tachypleus tridentatus]|uniref:uncharacterized protein LOC143226836 isoform X2 n=1 Tax=Tachypleus tridentatus TaxID=6853 RepID=UPI003FD19054